MTHTQLDSKLIANDIQERLTRKDSFIDQVIIDDAYATQVSINKKVAVPQTGALPDVVIDDTNPLSVDSGTDTHITYDVHSYRTKPIVIRNFEDYFVNYEKQQSVTREQASQLKNTFTKHAMYLWGKQATDAASNQKIITTGSNRSATTGSGSRKALTFEDLLSVRKKLTKNGGDQGAGNYFGIISAEMYADLLKLPEVKTGNHKLNTTNIPGAVMELLGFTIFLREDLPRFSSGHNSATLLEMSATASSTTCTAAIFFHKALVRRTISPNVSVFVEVSAGRAGVELSSELFGGASLARTDARGLVLLSES